jgi:hypothetical protein
MVESRRQARGRNGGLQGGQRVRPEMFEEVARSNSLHLCWLRTAIRRLCLHISTTNDIASTTANVWAGFE